MWEYIYNEDFWTWEFAISSISQQSWLLPVLVSPFVKIWTPTRRRVIAFVCFTLLMEHLSTDKQIKYLFREGVNAPWYHLLTPLLFFFMSNIFLPVITKKRFRFLRWLLPLVFVGIALLGILDEEEFYHFPGLTVGLYSVVGILLALIYFLTLLKNLTVRYLERLPMFWVASGLLIYLSGNFLLWISLFVVEYDRVLFGSIYRLNSGLTIFLNCFLTAAMLINNPEINLKRTDLS